MVGEVGGQRVETELVGVGAGLVSAEACVQTAMSQDANTTLRAMRTGTTSSSYEKAPSNIGYPSGRSTVLISGLARDLWPANLVGRYPSRRIEEIDLFVG